MLLLLQVSWKLSLTSFFMCGTDLRRSPPQSARAAAVEDSWTNKRTEHTITHELLQMDNYSGHLYLNLYLYLYNICVCICICMQCRGGPWANKQAITRLDHKRRWTMAPLWNHLHGHHGHSNLTHHTHALHTAERERGWCAANCEGYWADMESLWKHLHSHFWSSQAMG